MGIKSGMQGIVWVGLLGFLLGGCDRAHESDPARYEALVAFDTAVVRIESATDTFRLNVELAATQEQRSFGLMERPHLPEHHGMLFIYSEPQDSSAGFWMFRTRIPLDIAFLDREGRIVAVQAMEPCESPDPRFCRIYSPGVPYSRALEVNRGYLAERGIGIGDRVVLLSKGEESG